MNIYKFPIVIKPGNYVIPKCRKVLSCGLDPAGNCAIWYVHDEGNYGGDTVVSTLFTGETLDEATAGMRYVGMVQQFGLVLHVLAYDQ
jgi:hypothetical protein